MEKAKEGFSPAEGAGTASQRKTLKGEWSLQDVEESHPGSSNLVSQSRV